MNQMNVRYTLLCRDHLRPAHGKTTQKLLNIVHFREHAKQHFKVSHFSRAWRIGYISFNLSSLEKGCLIGLNVYTVQNV